MYDVVCQTLPAFHRTCECITCHRTTTLAQTLGTHSCAKPLDGVRKDCVLDGSGSRGPTVFVNPSCDVWLTPSAYYISMPLDALRVYMPHDALESLLDSRRVIRKGDYVHATSHYVAGRHRCIVYDRRSLVERDAARLRFTWASGAETEVSALEIYDALASAHDYAPFSQSSWHFNASYQNDRNTTEMEKIIGSGITTNGGRTVSRKEYDVFLYDTPCTASQVRAKCVNEKAVSAGDADRQLVPFVVIFTQQPATVRVLKKLTPVAVHPLRVRLF